LNETNTLDVVRRPSYFSFLVVLKHSKIASRGSGKVSHDMMQRRWTLVLKDDLVGIFVQPKDMKDRWNGCEGQLQDASIKHSLI